MLSQKQIKQLKLDESKSLLSKRLQHYHYYGLLEEYQLHPTSIINSFSYNKLNSYQLFLFKRVLEFKSVETSDLLILFRISSPTPGVAIFEPGFIKSAPLPSPFKILVIPPIGIACTLIVSKNTKNKDRHRSIKYDLVLTIRNIKLHELY